MTRSSLIRCSALVAALHPAVQAEEAAPPTGLARTLVAREPMLKNPVAVTVDVDGTIYVAETARRKAGDLDIRDFRGWIPETLGHRSVAERVAFYEKSLPPGEDHASNGLRDLNGDGVADFRDLTAISEKIHRLVDTDGDGKADTSTVFADGFATPATGVAAGVFAWRGDVYATIVPDLWKLRDTNGDGRADQREALLTGFGVHIAYAGHDMHGVTLGPDGRIYWTIGDKAAAVVSKEGELHEDLLTGLLMRCEPDGTNYEVVARGLRNVQQIAFDDWGNIFGVDNDSDAPGEKERFLHIAEGSDSGWRKYYQYRGSGYNPWMAESLSVPEGPDQPAYLTPAVCSYHDGPAGFARDPGTALGERYRGAFFMTAFPAGVVYSFKVEPDGASFRMVDSHIADKGPAYVGCAFGPDGALYLADGAGDYALNDKGAVWKLDDPESAGNSLRREVARLLREDPAGADDAGLLGRLKHPDQRIRSDAHLELARRPRGPELLEKAAAEWGEAHPLACTHALWGLARAGRFSPDLFARLAAAGPERTRAQAAKWAGESAAAPVPGLIPLLADPSLVVRYHAAMAVGRLGMTEALDPVLAMAASSPDDARLRHATVVALAGMEREALGQALAHESPAVRLVAAVVCRRTGDPAVARLLGDGDPAVACEAARAIYDDRSIESAAPALAALLEESPDARRPAILRSIHTNRRLADSASAARLSRFAADESRPKELRLAALRALVSWPEKIALDPVDGRFRPCAPADRGLARSAFASIADELRQHADPNISAAAAAVADALEIEMNPTQLAAAATDGDLPEERRVQALGSLRATGAPEFETTAVALLADDSPQIRMAAADALPPARRADYLRLTAGAGEHLPERQTAIRLLAADGDSEAVPILRELLENARATPEIQLDLLEAAELLPELAGEAERLRETLAKDDPLGPHLPALEGGDPARGRDIFDNHLAAQCTACHRLGTDGSTVGPPLGDIGRQPRRHLLESLVDPQAKIADGYGSVSTMPPMGAILSPAELRDLVAFLATCRE